MSVHGARLNHCGSLTFTLTIKTNTCNQCQQSILFPLLALLLFKWLDPLVRSNSQSYQYSAPRKGINAFHDLLPGQQKDEGIQLNRETDSNSRLQCYAYGRSECDPIFISIVFLGSNINTVLVK
jgi:hypothetical protein